jgi:hypothetical protein
MDFHLAFQDGINYQYFKMAFETPVHTHTHHVNSF